MGRKEQTAAMRHADRLGAGAAKRRHLGSADKAATVMREFYRGTLHSGSGGVVTNPKQAKAIAMSEAKRHRGGK